MPARASRAPGRRVEGKSAADYIPSRPTLPKLRIAAAGCHGCHLWRLGTQTVFGEGAAKARLMVVGEQPGDREDRAGRPFVGPSGALLDAALEEAGIERSEIYVTNAVKHFKWERRGAKSARRIHKTPNTSEIRACRPWLDAEIALVGPRLLLCLGATAAKALLGKDFRITRSRGEPIAAEALPTVIATVHPSAVLRTPRESRPDAERAFFADVAAAAQWLSRHRRGNH